MLGSSATPLEEITLCRLGNEEDHGVSEPDRHDLYRGLEDALSRRRVETVLDMVRSVPWAEVATRSDLAAVRTATKQEIARVREELGNLRDEMDGAPRAQLPSIITVAAVFNDMTVTALRLL